MCFAVEGNLGSGMQMGTEIRSALRCDVAGVSLLLFKVRWATAAWFCNSQTCRGGGLGDLGSPAGPDRSSENHKQVGWTPPHPTAWTATGSMWALLEKKIRTTHFPF